MTEKEIRKTLETVVEEMKVKGIKFEDETKGLEAVEKEFSGRVDMDTIEDIDLYDEILDDVIEVLLV